MARNKYSGVCHVCHLPVAPGSGHFELCYGKWLVKHALYPGHGRVTCEMAKNAPVYCEECLDNIADPPSRLCPGCEAYKEHQA